MLIISVKAVWGVTVSLRLRAMGYTCQDSGLCLLWVSLCVYSVVAFRMALLSVTPVYKAAVCRELLHVECQARRTPPCLSKQTGAICQHSRSGKLINGSSMTINSTCELAQSYRNTRQKGLALYQVSPHTRTLKEHCKTAMWPCMPASHSVASQEKHHLGAQPA